MFNAMFIYIYTSDYFFFWFFLRGVWFVLVWFLLVLSYAYMHSYFFFMGLYGMGHSLMNTYELLGICSFYYHYIWADSTCMHMAFWKLRLELALVEAWFT